MPQSFETKFPCKGVNWSHSWIFGNNIMEKSCSKICHPKMSLWHADYFEMQTTKAQTTQEETLTFPLTA